MRLGIPIGAVLNSVRTDDDTVTVEVVGEGQVRFQGEEMSFAMATRRLLELDDSRAIRPAPYWSYEGRILLDMYNEAYDIDD